MSSPGFAALDDERLKMMGGDKTFMRGLAYHREGRVKVRSQSADDIEARVKGSKTYTTRISLTEKGITFSCTCPAAEEGFCKHGVAVALVARDGEAAAANVARTEKRLATAERNREALEAFLLRQSTEVLVQKLVALAEQSRDGMRELRFWMKSDSAQSGSLKSLVLEELRASGFVDYRGSRAYAARVHRVRVLLRQRMEKGEYEACAEAALAALKKLFKVGEQCDDSDGLVGDGMHAIRDLHVEALGHAKVDRAGLARTVFDLMLADPWSIVDWKHYQDVLGDEGTAELGAILEKAWRALPKRADPVSSHDRDEFDARASYLDSMMERWWVTQGNLAGVVEVKSRSLTHPWNYLEIVRYLEKNGKGREARDWAERANRVFPAERSVMEALLGCYERDGMDEEAQALRWQLFEVQPSLQGYAAVVKGAGKGAAKARKRAMDIIVAEENARVAAPNSAFLARWNPHYFDVSLRVAVHLHEGEVARAIEVARDKPVGSGTLLALAKACAKSHGPESHRLFDRLIEGALKPTDNRAYEQVCEYLLEMRTALGVAHFAKIREDIMQSYKARRNLVKMLTAL